MFNPLPQMRLAKVQIICVILPRGGIFDFGEDRWDLWDNRDLWDADEA